MKYVFALMLCMFTISAQAQYLRTIDDFTLPTVTGEQVRLSDHTNYVAVYIQGNGCPIARLGSHDYREVIGEFVGSGISFYMMNANIQDTVESIVREESDFAFAVPVLKDTNQSVAKALGVERTAEVFVLVPQTGEVVYRGPINDKLGYETQRTGQVANYLVDALRTLLSGQEVDHSNIPDSKGCLVALF